MITSIISAITGIDRAVLLSSGFNFKECSIARRMSWAANRETTRVEDIAYCLLGIFDINMPLLYGERERAFGRLQEELINRYDDDSILAWGFHQSTIEISRSAPFADDAARDWWVQRSGGPVLARSPKDFRGCHDMQVGKAQLNITKAKEWVL